jgi:hypothetical protein
LPGFSAQPLIFAHLAGMAYRGDLRFFPGTEFENFLDGVSKALSIFPPEER